MISALVSVLFALLAITSPSRAAEVSSGVPAGCIASPLPAASKHVLATLAFTGHPISDRFSATFWRQPCLHDPLLSAVLMRITPDPGGSVAICSSSFHVSQNGTNFGQSGWITTARGYPVCSRFFLPTTFAFHEPTRSFDDQKAFSLSPASWGLYARPNIVAIPAYAPNLTRRTLTVTLVGNGSGQIVSAPAGIECSTGSCSAGFHEDVPVALTAEPLAGSRFAGWDGACAASGSSPVARITIAGDAACAARFDPPRIDPQSGWWWAPAEPGRGYSLELRNGRLFVASYAYRSDGQSTWYLSEGRWDGYRLATALTEYAGGQTIGGSWKQASRRSDAATATLAFSSPAHGTLTWGDGRSVAIERFPFAGSPQPAPDDVVPAATSAPRDDDAVRLQALRDAVTSRGMRRVIVRLHGSGVAAADGQRMQSALGQSGSQIVTTYQALPLVVADVTSSGLEALLSDPSIAAVHEDTERQTFLSASVPRIGASRLRSGGHGGQGQTVAILDTGIDKSHPFLAGRVISEACFSSPVPSLGIVSACPNREATMIGAGAGLPCASQSAGCYHGTHVAGIVAGRGETFSGVAPEASLLSIQVFKIVPPVFCASFQPCLGASDSDIIRGLQHVRDNAARLNIASVNLSLGGGRYSAYCDDLPYKPIIDQLKAAGVATIVATGNNGLDGEVAAPACTSSAMRVGATTSLDALASFSNSWALPMVLAPGDAVTSSVPGAAFKSLRGTSMATPHVAGAWAVLRSAAPTARMETILAALTDTGTAVVNPATSRPYPRIDVAAAHDRLNDIETGWWWNAAEPGSGYFVETGRGILFLSAYTYRDDGSAAWYVASGPYSRGIFEGTLQEYGGGQALGGAWRPAQLQAEHGPITLQSTGSGSARLTLPNGRRVALTRFSF